MGMQGETASTQRAGYPLVNCGIGFAYCNMSYICFGVDFDHQGSVLISDIRELCIDFSRIPSSTLFLRETQLLVS
ncbi:hypothetical protein SLE2022_083750 [Rubroshorea leprosula]